jgi:hypothetical protein
VGFHLLRVHEAGSLPHFGDESTFLEVKKYLPDEGVSDDYNLYFWLKDHTVVSPVNPNESFLIKG